MDYVKAKTDNTQGSKGDPLRIVQETEISPYWWSVYAQTRICARKWKV